VRQLLNHTSGVFNFTEDASPSDYDFSRQMLHAVGIWYLAGGSTVQVIERFQAQANDGRVVEILKWGPSVVDDGNREPTGQAPTIYATVGGWRCDPTRDGGYLIVSSGVKVRRVGYARPAAVTPAILHIVSRPREPRRI
jgi:hypothetical protein